MDTKTLLKYGLVFVAGVVLAAKVKSLPLGNKIPQL
jgi:hypothetical protein